MPKRAQELTAKTVATLKSKGRHAVGGAVGLYLRIEGTNRWWLLRIKVGRRRRDMGLGSYPEVSLAEARERARAKRKAISWSANLAQSHYPTSAPAAPQTQAQPVHVETLPDPRSQRPAPTFESCARTYVAAQEPGWKSRQHGKQWLSTLETYAFPVIGSLHPDAVTTDHILRILKPVWSTKTETATRLRGRIESILDWTEHRGYRS